MRVNRELEAPLPQPQIDTIISELFKHKRRSSSGQTSRLQRQQPQSCSAAQVELV